MSVEKLITEHMDVWAGAVTQKAASGRSSGGNRELIGVKKLRELILDLATRGKLVPQDANDPTADELLQLLADERLRLTKAGMMPKSKALPAIDQPGFDAPSGWKWARLGTITQKIGSGATPRGGKSAYVTDGIPFLRSQNIWNDGLRIDDVARISEETHKQMRNTHVQANDILLNITGASLGRCALVPPDFETANVSQHVTIIRVLEPFCRQFLHLLILAPYTQSLIWGRQVGMAREGLSKKVLELFEIPVPPLAEQHRIVQKVDELLALCDRLEQQTGDQIEAHERLVDTLLESLTRAENATELTENWARVAQHFDTLFTTEHSIDHLKQTILQLAVMGRLTEGRFGAEPADSLLSRISTLKSELIAAGAAKQARKSPNLNDGERYRIPDHWLWCRLSDVCSQITDGEHNTPERTPSKHATPLVTAKNVRDGYLDLSNTDFVPNDVAKACWNRCKPQVNDILMVSVGATLGRLSVVLQPQDMVLVRSVTLIRPLIIDVRYLDLVLRAPLTQKWIWENVKQAAQPCLYLAKSSAIPVPLPPIEEQAAAVTAATNLLNLCGDIAERLRISQRIKVQMAGSV